MPAAYPRDIEANGPGAIIQAVSERNVQIVRGALDAVDRSDWDALLTMATPEFEIDLSRAVGPIHGIYGVDRIRELLGSFAASWESLRFEPEEVIDAGEDVVVPWTLHARGRDGIEVVSRVTWVWTVREARVTRAVMYQERSDALAAVGLSS